MDSEVIEFNVKFDTIFNIANGKKTKFERDVSNDEIARKLFVTDENGEYVCRDEYKDEMDLPLCFVNITHMGYCPFVLRKYNKIKFVDWYGGEVVADIRTTCIYRYDKYWRISYGIENIIKIK